MINEIKNNPGITTHIDLYKRIFPVFLQEKFLDHVHNPEALFTLSIHQEL